MKRLLLLTAIFLVSLLGFAQEMGITRYQLQNTLDDSKDYYYRVKSDGGFVNSDAIVKGYYLMSEDNGMRESIEFAWLGEAGNQFRTSTIYDYLTDIYDLSDNDNDGAQTTEASQPYLTGNIAPNEHWGMKNPSGDGRYVTHPTISFGANEAWSVTTIINIENISSNIHNHYVYNNVYRLSYKYNNIRTFYVRANSSETDFSISPLPYVGKNTIVTIVRYATNSIELYINGELKSTKTNVGDMAFGPIFSTEFPQPLCISAHIIRSQALSPEQVAAEAAFLQTIYPEIPSVKIGAYDVATSNFEAVASSNGTVITEAADNTDWATGAARWRYYGEDSQIGSWGGKLYNKAARDVIIANPPSGYHVATEAELTVLAAYGANKLKAEGSDYWTTANGTNSTGFSAVGSGMVNTDGTFADINDMVGIWCADSDKALIINDSDIATVSSVSANEGYCIRLIKD